jgi:putative colanic acid biosynthesis acetyltransferase WcaF
MGQNSPTPYPVGEILLRMVWSVIEATLFRWSPRPLHAWRILLLRVFGAEVPTPSTVRVFPSVRITFPWKLTLEPHTMVGPRVALYNLGRITLRRGVNISQNCHLCAGTHDFNRWSMPLVTKPIVIGENVWLAADVFVGPGVTIGELCVVGARSVVIRDLPSRKICVGHPCRAVKDRVEPPIE